MSCLATTLGPFSEANREVADQDDPAVQAGALRQGRAVRTPHKPYQAAVCPAQACVLQLRLCARACAHSAPVQCECLTRNPPLPLRPNPLPNLSHDPRSFRRASYIGEDFGKVIQDFVKAPVNSGKSVRQQRETVYHLYAQQQIHSQEAGQPEPSTREPDKQEVGES